MQGWIARLIRNKRKEQSNDESRFEQLNKKLKTAENYHDINEESLGGANSNITNSISN